MMNQRSEVVLSVLGELQNATESSGLEALILVAREVEQILAPFQLPQALCQAFPAATDIDDVAHSLYPADAPGDLLPVACKGEGNLLFDAASVLLVGTTALSLELQVRTVVEMLLYKRYYLCGMIDSKMMLQAVRFSLCADESEAMLNLPVAVLEAIFDADVKASCFPGSYANMWHVYALASVLRRGIYSVYPAFNLKIRPYFNRLVRPRAGDADAAAPTLHIMWSGELRAGGSVFLPHRFVALAQASDLNTASPANEQSKTLQLLNKDSQLSYASLKDKYNITKTTFYRWRRQSTEHRQKSAVRYEAKHFLQACYREGKVVPLQQFKEFFPGIPRSTYYDWKQELMSSGGSFYHKASPSTGEVSPVESTEAPESWASSSSSPEARQSDPETHEESVASMFGLTFGAKTEADRAHNHAQMQDAKRCLQTCIATNTSFPFRAFKKSFPGISRSTYYNWRREAMLFGGGFKPSSSSSTGSGEDSSDGDKSHSPTSLPSPPIISVSAQPSAPRIRLFRRNHESLRRAYMSKKHLRDEAKRHVQRSKWSLMKFKLKYPSMSPCLYWQWRNERKRVTPVVDVAESMERVNMATRMEEQAMERSLGRGPAPMEEQAIAAQVKEEPIETQMQNAAMERKTAGQNVFSFEGSPEGLSSSPTTMLPHLDGSLSMYTLPAALAPAENHMFVMDVVALANFKAKAKLFLQQRFEEKSFPTFKEFRARFPLTPRSTYYMWKRALHHGVPLIHG